LTSGLEDPPVTAAMREVMFQLVGVVAVHEGNGEKVNAHDWPAVNVLAGAMVTAPPAPIVPVGVVVTSHPVPDAGIVTERRATDVVPKSAGTRMVHVTEPRWRRAMDAGDTGVQVIVTRERSGVTRRAEIVVEPESQLAPGLHIWSDITEDTVAPDTPPEDGARRETVNVVAVAGAR
jgi:hypothetical protein